MDRHRYPICSYGGKHLHFFVSGLRYPVMPQARYLLLFTVFGLYCLSYIVDISFLQRCIIILFFLYAWYSSNKTLFCWDFFPKWQVYYIRLSIILVKEIATKRAWQRVLGLHKMACRQVNATKRYAESHSKVWSHCHVKDWHRTILLQRAVRRWNITRGKATRRTQRTQIRDSKTHHREGPDWPTLRSSFP
jgi:hypothetical protein